MGLSGDERAVSTLIGAVFLIGVLVILLSIYQATIVPQQNKKVEFDHNMRVQNDMIELRNAILDAKSLGQTTFAEVELGTDYPPRTFGLNPPPAAGSLRTGEAKSIEVFNETGDPKSDDICPRGAPINTKYLTYKPNYHEYENPPTVVYENSVAYLNFSGRNVLLTNETLVQEDSINLSPINTTYSESGVGMQSVEPIPGLVKTRDIEGAIVEFPSRLSASTWKKMFSADDESNLNSVTKTNGKIRIEAKSDTTIQVACSPIGLGETPGGRRGSGDTNINPVAPNDVQLVNISLSSNKQTLTVKLRNNNDDTDAKISRVRLAFFHTPDGIDEMEINELGNDTTPRLRMQLLGEFKTADPDYEIPKNTTVGPSENTKSFEFTVYDTSAINSQRSFDKNQDWFTIQAEFSNGITATYFVSAENFGIA